MHGSQDLRRGVSSGSSKERGWQSTAKSQAGCFLTEVQQTVRHRKHPPGLTDCRGWRGWRGWGTADVHVGPEQFQACQLQAGRLRTGRQTWEELLGLMVVREGERQKEGVVVDEGLRPWVGDALRRLNCLDLAPPDCVGWGGVTCRASVCSPTVPALGLGPGESRALGQPTKARHCWQGSAGQYLNRTSQQGLLQRCPSRKLPGSRAQPPLFSSARTPFYHLNVPDLALRDTTRKLHGRTSLKSSSCGLIASLRYRDLGRSEESWREDNPQAGLEARAGKMRESSGLRVRCSSTWKTASGAKTGFCSPKGAQSSSSHLPPKCYVTQPERQEEKAHPWPNTGMAKNREVGPRDHWGLSSELQRAGLRRPWPE
ncbi:hypothetical protein Cadr_000019462 [Camelus dromedarius]|uniref:Uncharacterized protein n=1 Tax=Camelus dromedarius TaxID=9838 RepID=A0A5N4D137_CAMDR|nr:hypothetical protein Cadr_000019462 [Camelus dromedarius]